MGNNKQRFNNYRGIKRREDNKNLQKAKSIIENKLFEEKLSENIKVWTLDEPEEKSSWLIVEIHFNKPISALELQNIMRKRMGDLIE